MTAIKWLVDLFAKKPLLGVVALLLIALGIQETSRRDEITKNKTLTADKIVLQSTIDNLKTQIMTVGESYHNRKRADDSTEISKLQLSIKNLEDRIRQESDVTSTLKSTIIKHKKTIQVQDNIKSRNEQKINALKNDL